MPFEAIDALKDSGYYDGERLEEAAHSLPEYGIELVTLNEAGSVAEIATDFGRTVPDAACIVLAQTADTIVCTADSTRLENLSRASGELANYTKTRTWAAGLLCVQFARISAALPIDTDIGVVSLVRIACLVDPDIIHIPVRLSLSDLDGLR